MAKQRSTQMVIDYHKVPTESLVYLASVQFNTVQFPDGELLVEMYKRGLELDVDGRLLSVLPVDIGHSVMTTIH